MRRFLLPLIALLSALLSLDVRAAGSAPDAPLTPAQAAYFKAESRKADDRFVQEVARITQVPEASIRKTMPPDGRIVDPAARVIKALEHQRGQVLPDEIKAQINVAEAERRSALTAARAAAAKR